MIQESGSGSISGTGYDPGTNQEYATITGNVSGSNVTITTTYTADAPYAATFTGTVAPNGSTMYGNWTSNANQSGTWTATLVSGSTTTSTTPTTPTTPAGLRKSATQVNCYDTNPGEAGDFFQCTAAVGDASGQATQDTPTGTVAFAINPGGGGGFQGFSSCSLVRSQTGGPTSFCSVNYVPPSGGIPIGSQPPITGTYSGDKVFGSSGGQPQTIKAAEADFCSQIYDPVCAGLVSLPPALADTCVSLTGCSPGAQNDQTEDVTISPDQNSLVITTNLPTLTPAEWDAYLSSPNPDPELAARVKYLQNYNTYTNTVNAVRGDVLQSIQDSLAKAAANSSSFGSVTFPAASVLWTPGINQLLDAAASSGTAVATPDLAFISDHFCASAQDPAGCSSAVQAVRDYVAGALDVLKDKKDSLGVNVPYTAPPKTTKGLNDAEARLARKAKSKHTVRTIVLAKSKLVKLAPGAKTKIRIPISASVRAELKKALGSKRTRTIHADLVVIIASDGNYTVRTIPVTIRLTQPGKKHH